MKAASTFLLIILLGFNTNALKGQLVIHNAEKYNVGTTYTYWKADESSFNSGSGGKDVVWDFSGLTKLQTEYEGQVLLPSQTQHPNTFSNANEVRQSSNGASLFLELKSDSVFIRGFVQNSPQIEITYIKPQLFALNPIKYGDSVITTSEYTYNFGNQNFIGGGRFAMYADGMGKLILDGKTYEDVLRVRIEQNNADTIKPFNSIVSTTKITAYRWYNRYSGLSLLSVDSVVVQSQAGTQNSVEVLALKNTFGAVSVKEHRDNNFTASVLYDKVNIIGLNSSIQEVKIFDITGKLIAQKKFSTSSNNATIKLGRTPKVGEILIINVSTENKVHTLKVAVL